MSFCFTQHELQVEFHPTLYTSSTASTAAEVIGLTYQNVSSAQVAACSDDIKSWYLNRALLREDDSSENEEEEISVQTYREQLRGNCDSKFKFLFKRENFLRPIHIDREPKESAKNALARAIAKHPSYIYHVTHWAPKETKKVHDESDEYYNFSYHDAFDPSVKANPHFALFRDLEHFKAFYSTKLKRHVESNMSCECVPSDKMCKLYFDIDFEEKTEQDETKLTETINLLYTSVFDKLQKSKSKMAVSTNNRWLYKDGVRNGYKLSGHVVFANLGFESIDKMKRFATHLTNTVDGLQTANGDGVDLSVYRENISQLRLPGSFKHNDPEKRTLTIRPELYKGEWQDTKSWVDFLVSDVDSQTEVVDFVGTATTKKRKRVAKTDVESATTLCATPAHAPAVKVQKAVSSENVLWDTAGVTQWLTDQLKTSVEYVSDKNVYTVRTASSITCPFAKRVHHSNNAFVFVKASGVAVLRCHSQHCVGQEQIVGIVSDELSLRHDVTRQQQVSVVHNPLVHNFFEDVAGEEQEVVLEVQPEPEVVEDVAEHVESEEATGEIVTQTTNKVLYNPRKLFSPLITTHEDDVMYVLPYRFGKGQKMLLVEASCGSGKTTQLEKYVNENLNWTTPVSGQRKRHNSILFITNRCSLQEALLHTYPLLKSYKQEGSLEQPHLLCQVESLHRIDPVKKYDLLVLDEIRSIFRELACEVTNGYNLAENFLRFYTLVHSADRIIALDAHMFADACTMDAVLRLVPEFQIRAHVYKHVKQRTTWKIYSTTESWVARMRQAITDGDKFGVCTRASTTAAAIYKDLLALTKDESKISITTGASSSEQKSLWGSPDESFKDTTFLIYTSAVTVGCNLTLPFQHVFIDVTSRFGPTASEIMQMKHRFRNLQGVVHLVMNEVTKAERFALSRVDKILDDMAFRRNTLSKQTKNVVRFDSRWSPDWATLVIAHTRDEGDPMQFKKRLLDLIAREGNTIEWVPASKDHMGSYNHVANENEVEAKELASREDLMNAEARVAAAFCIVSLATQTSVEDENDDYRRACERFGLAVSRVEDRTASSLDYEIVKADTIFTQYSTRLDSKAYDFARHKKLQVKLMAALLRDSPETRQKLGCSDASDLQTRKRANVDVTAATFRPLLMILEALEELLRFVGFSGPLDVTTRVSKEVFSEKADAIIHRCTTLKKLRANLSDEREKDMTSKDVGEKSARMVRRELEALLCCKMERTRGKSKGKVRVHTVFYAIEHNEVLKQVADSSKFWM